MSVTINWWSQTYRQHKRSQTSVTNIDRTQGSLSIPHFVEFLDGYWSKRSVQFQPYHDDDTEHVRTCFETFLQVPNQLKIIDYSRRHQSRYCLATKNCPIRGQNVHFKILPLRLDEYSHDDEVFQVVQSVDLQSSIQSFHLNGCMVGTFDIPFVFKRRI